MNRIKAGSKCSIPPTQDELWKIATHCCVLRDKVFPDVYMFVHKHKNIPAPVMIEALESIARHKPKDPWPYGVKILQIQKGIFWARVAEEENRRHNSPLPLFSKEGDKRGRCKEGAKIFPKSPVPAKEILAEVMNNIGGLDAKNRG